MPRRVIEVRNVPGIHCRTHYRKRNDFRPTLEFYAPTRDPLKEGEYIRAYTTTSYAAETARIQKEEEIARIRETPDQEPLLADCLLLKGHLRQLEQSTPIWRTLDPVRSYGDYQDYNLRNTLHHFARTPLEEYRFNELLTWLEGAVTLLRKFNTLEEEARKKHIQEEEEQTERDRVRAEKRKEYLQAQLKKEYAWHPRQKRTPRIKPLTRQATNPLRGILTRQVNYSERLCKPQCRHARFLISDWDHWNEIDEWGYVENRKELYYSWDAPDDLVEDVDNHIDLVRHREIKTRNFVTQKFGRKRKAHRAGLDASPWWKRRKR